MIRWRFLLGLVALGPLLIAARTASAAPTAAGKSSITITSPSPGATVQGSTLTVTVKVQNFQLVPPVYINPPKLSGNRGHIHYVLDKLANFNARRDAKVALSHTWTNVSPGRHTIIVFLATSQHALFPGTKGVSVTVTVVPRSSGGGTTPTVAPRATAVPTRSLSSAPVTGGAGDNHDLSPTNLLLLLAGGLALVAGLALLLGRVLLGRA